MGPSLEPNTLDSARLPGTSVPVLRRGQIESECRFLDRIVRQNGSPKSESGNGSAICRESRSRVRHSAAHPWNIGDCRRVVSFHHGWCRCHASVHSPRRVRRIFPCLHPLASSGRGMEARSAPDDNKLGYSCAPCITRTTARSIDLVNGYIAAPFSRRLPHDRDYCSPSRCRWTFLSARCRSAPPGSSHLSFSDSPFSDSSFSDSVAENRSRPGLHRSPRGLHIFRPCGRRCVRWIENSGTLHRDVSQPHWHRPRPCDNERRHLGDSARLCTGRQRFRGRSQATLPASPRRCHRTPLRTRYRGRVALSTNPSPSHSAPESSKLLSNSVSPWRKLSLHTASLSSSSHPAT